VLYSSIRTASNSQASKLTGSDKLLVKDNGETGGSTDAEAQKVWDNESEEVRFYLDSRFDSYFWKTFFRVDYPRN